MLWTWQYRQMDKEMKLWCGETAGRRHAVERVSSRQPSSGPAMPTWSPRNRRRFRGRSTAGRRSSALIKPTATAGAGRASAPQREGSASRAVWQPAVVWSAQRCGASDRRAAATPSVTPSGWTPRRCSQRTTRRRPGRHGATRAPARSGRATPPRASAEHGAAGAAAEQQRTQRSHR